ncbi:M1 family metallopeptidase [Flavobacterium sp. NKUCC04_CG]|uniref:M1 family metallopeptidase n=1 Tax=Flavobacterium sp. NKUCC04_CG TaxID=2842121 RepID=UPI001C5ACDA0|nr:M1 family metallopeptidase [Flavobacterium sp. NKUCC04_CG]MBW3518176.1 M1 family metallopeptidase [Flavobacterium sp. NKUCC04_CG]
MHKFFYLVFGMGFLVAACGKQQALLADDKNVDTQTYAHLSKAKITHLSWDVEVDFEQKIIVGSATYDFENHQAKEIFFDSSQLVIDSVLLGNGKKTPYELGELDIVKGQALKVKISPKDKKVSIYYKTSPQASALQWLDPVQTHDKKQPYLLTQGQAILTRSYIPIQDTPSIRITYDATVRVPKDLLALMSAINPKEKSADGIYHFKMPQALPPYLIALAVGDLQYQAIDERTGVYAEPTQLKDAAWELADMGKMVDAAEQLYGAYPWGQFDVLILPPSFPFGGMENPRLTFATPTILVGDRSLTNLIAHELAHSWSGNLVTNATWNDFWLNEGFTVYFERRIMEALEGKDYADMITVIGYQDLQTDMKLLPKNLTSLYIDLTGINPDDAFSDVPYDKGFLFLKMLEDRYGRVPFDAFVKKYFKEKAFKTTNTEDFIVYLKENLTHGEDDFVQTWVYDTGWPKGLVVPTSKLFELVEKKYAADIVQIQKGKAISDELPEWSTNEWLHYIRLIDVTATTKEDIALIDQRYRFTDSKNAEIQCAWFEKSFRLQYDKVNSNAKDFLIQVGRRKFIEPLYLALKQTGQINFAKEIYQEARPNYHFLARQNLDLLLENPA